MSTPESRTCREIGALLVFYTCGETSEQENQRIEKHLAHCEGCAWQLAEERSLRESLMEALQAAEQVDSGGILLSQCRSELAEALDDLSAPPLRQAWRPFGWLRSVMVMRPVLSGATLLLAGVVVGTQVVPWVSERLNPGAGALPVRVSAAPKLSDEQLANMAVAAISLTPTVDGTPGGLQVLVRTEEPMVLSGSMDDPDLRRVLTYVVENGSQTDAGVRLDCLDALRLRTSDADVRRALLYAASKDQNPAVRMKAMDSLRDLAADPAVRETLIGALDHDANAGVRVEAVNLLVHSLEAESAGAPRNVHPLIGLQGIEPPLDPSLLRVVHALHELERTDPNPNVRLRSAAALRQIHSPEVQ